MKLISLAKSSLNYALEKEISLLSWTVIFVSFIFFRSFLEQFVAVSKPITLIETVYEFIHNLYFFAIAILLIWILLSLILKLKPHKLAYILVFGLFLVIMPTIIDMVYNHGEIFWSFYLLSSPQELFWQYISVFGHLPPAIVYFGTKIVFIITVFIVAAIIWLLTKSLFKTLLGAVLSYTILFVMGSFPTLAYYGYLFFTEPRNLANVHSFNIAAFFGAPKAILGVLFPSIQYSLAYKLDYLYFLCLFLVLLALFFLNSRGKFLAVIKNMRFPQITYHFGLFFAGLGLGVLQFGQNFELNFFSALAVGVMLLSIILSWEASVVFNDIYDLEIDKITNSDRPLPRGIFSIEEYRGLGIFFFLLAILGGLTIGLPFAVLLIAYQILAWAYSAKPFRLKKFPIVATLLSSLALIIVLFLGFILMSDNQSIAFLNWRITLLLVIASTLGLPIKDFKDTIGDKMNKVWTIPVIFGENNARVIIGTGIFISFILPIFFLNELRLFWPALILATAAFLVVRNKKIRPKLVLWPILGLVCCYGLIMAKVIFI